MESYQIPAVNLTRLEAEIEKLNKRASKLGCEPVKLTIGETVIVKKKDPIFETEYSYVYHNCTIEGESPKLAGWTLVAAIDPQENGELLIREVPKEKCPVEYRSTDLHCDHCNTNRRRKAVFILRHDNGEHKQIGRNCIKDFLGGADPESFLAKASYFGSIDGLLGDAQDEGWGMGGGSGLQTVSISRFLSATSIVMRRVGWMPRSKADPMMGQEATADIAWTICVSSHRKAVEKYIEKYNLNVEDGDVERAEAALVWGRTIDPQTADSSYLHDLGVCCRQEFVTHKNAGYVASVINAHQRVLERELATQRQSTQKSGYVGTLNKREIFTLTIMGTNSYETSYGAKTLVRFQDEQQNVLIWKATGSPDWLKLGETVNVKATVKEHSEYRGVQQTILGRVTPNGQAS